jgi:hypothetical protein
LASVILSSAMPFSMSHSLTVFIVFSEGAKVSAICSC